MSQVTAAAWLRDRFLHLAYWQVNDVKDVMMENIEKVLERGEKIEVRVVAATGLGGAAIDVVVTA